MIWLVCAVGAVIGFYALAALAVEIAAHLHARRAQRTHPELFEVDPSGGYGPRDLKP